MTMLLLIMMMKKMMMVLVVLIVLKLPTHITFVNTRGVWAQAKLPLPGQALYDRMCRQHDRLAHKQATFPDITCTPEVLEHLSFRIRTLPRALHAEDKSFDGGPQLPATAPCPLPQHALLHCFSHTSTLWQECGTANSATGYVTAGST